MSYTSKEQKAIAWYMDKNKCVVQLSVKPNMRFMKKNSLNVVEINLNELVDNYTVSHKEEVKETRRRLQEEKNNTRRFSKYKEQY